MSRRKAAERPVWTVDVVAAVLLTCKAFEATRGGETVWVGVSAA